MALERRLGMTDLTMKGILKWDKNMVKGLTYGQIRVTTMDNGKIMLSRQLVLISGQMVDNMKEIGKTINCMEKESMIGQMVENMKAIMKTIKSKVMECISGLMVEYMKDIGT
jgi:hypothetical protein